jgi:Fe-S-cluster containining protein
MWVNVSMTPDQNCRQCGRCCEKWGWGQQGVIGDIIPWIEGNRQDILQHVSIQFTDGERLNGKDITLEDLPRVARIRYWVGNHGRALRHCPFFYRADDGKAYCRIHDAKPAVCIRFTPWNEKIRDYALNCPACRETAP